VHLKPVNKLQQGKMKKVELEEGKQRDNIFTWLNPCQKSIKEKDDKDYDLIDTLLLQHHTNMTQEKNENTVELVPTNKTELKVDKMNVNKVVDERNKHLEKVRVFSQQVNVNVDNYDQYQLTSLLETDNPYLNLEIEE